MKYRNAQDIFPEQLLKQIQRYVSGETIYVPAGNDKKSWGETSGYQQFLKERNQKIKNEFAEGRAIQELADVYALSFDTIKRIVYSKKEEVMLEYKATLTSARQYAAEGKLDAWIHLYLNSEGHNIPFSDGLKLYDRYYIEPIMMPTKFFKRCCGPEEEMKYRVDGEWFAHKVKDFEKVISENQDISPLIAHYVDSDFEMNDGNHRLQAYMNLGIDEIPVIIWITEEEEYKEFVERYKEYVKDAKVIRR